MRLTAIVLAAAAAIQPVAADVPLWFYVSNLTINSSQATQQFHISLNFYVSDQAPNDTSSSSSSRRDVWGTRFARRDDSPPLCDMTVTSNTTSPDCAGDSDASGAPAFVTFDEVGCGSPSYLGGGYANMWSFDRATDFDGYSVKTEWDPNGAVAAGFRNVTLDQFKCAADSDGAVEYYDGPTSYVTPGIRPGPNGSCC